MIDAPQSPALELRVWRELEEVQEKLTSLQCGNFGVSPRRLRFLASEMERIARMLELDDLERAP